MAKLVGGLSFPIAAPGVDGSLLALCDPFLAVAVPFFRDSVNRAFSTAYTAAMAGQAAIADPTQAACVQTCTHDPAPWLTPHTHRFPILALYLVSGEPEKPTQGRTIGAKHVYRMVYVLPSMHLDQAERVLPLLNAFPLLINYLIESLCDPQFDNNEDPWGDAGLSEINMGRYNVGFLSNGSPGQDKAAFFPQVSIDIETHLEADIDPTEYPDLITTAVDVQADVANPLTVTSAEDPPG